MSLEYFKVFLPREVVSGDFYWSKLVGSYFYLSVVDCTGHGVPGAFMSMLGVAFLNEISNVENLPSTNSILDSLRDKVIKVLNQSGAQQSNTDGMDMAIIRLDLETLKMQYSGAMNSIYIVRNDEGAIEEVKADRMPICFSSRMNPFNVENLELKKDDRVFIFSDGFADQFGGDFNKKYGYKQFRKSLLTSSNLSMKDQGDFMQEELKNWMSDQSQVDDVTLIGFGI